MSDEKKRSPKVEKHLKSKFGTKFKKDVPRKKQTTLGGVTPPKRLRDAIDEELYANQLTQMGGKFGAQVDPQPSMKKKIKVALKGPLGALKDDVAPELLERVRKEDKKRKKKALGGAVMKARGGTFKGIF